MTRYLCQCAAVFTATIWPLLLIGAAVEGLQPWPAMLLLSAASWRLAGLMAKYGRRQ